MATRFDYGPDGYYIEDAYTDDYIATETLVRYVDWSDPAQRPHAPAKQYLDKTVSRELDFALRAAVTERPENLLEFVGTFLVEAGRRKAEIRRQHGDLRDPPAGPPNGPPNGGPA